MRVLITAGWLGGAGGAERAVHATLHALREDYVDVVVRQELGGPWADVPTSVNVIQASSWRRRGADPAVRYKRRIAKRLLNPVRRRLLREYDIHLAFAHGPDMTTLSRAKIRLFNPCGNQITSLARAYDFAALEAPDNSRLVSAGCSTLLLPPPLFPLAEKAEPVAEVPSEFFLTVFNPYDPIKGADDLAIAANSAPLPIVWCHSNRTVEFEPDPHLSTHPNIVHVNDPSPAEMLDMYENCALYLSFSRSEGFGWAAADGLQHARGVVSRPVGVLSFPESHQDGVYLIGDRWEMDWSLTSASTGPRPERDLTWLAPESFRSVLQGLVEANGPSPSR